MLRDPWVICLNAEYGAPKLVIRRSEGIGESPAVSGEDGLRRADFRFAAIIWVEYSIRRQLGRSISVISQRISEFR